MMVRTIKPHCALCQTKECRTDEKDCYEAAEQHLAMYDAGDLAPLHRAATAIEGRHYCRATRLEEVMLFAQEMGFRKLGLAFCLGLAEEALVIEQILSQRFTVLSACCKTSGVNKRRLDLEQIDADDAGEVMCNPAGQADLLNRAGTELNIICGLCVGHDAIFSKASAAPVTTLIAKDRVLAHNPVGAIHTPYLRRRFFRGTAAAAGPRRDRGLRRSSHGASQSATRGAGTGPA
jgi:uncharacterized metal-binding protein